MQSLNEIPVESLLGVGERTAKLLSVLNIHSLQDLLFHLPSRYEDRTRVIPLSQLKSGEPALIVGKVSHCKITGRDKKQLICQLTNEEGSVYLHFFHFASYQQKKFEQKNLTWHCYGVVQKNYLGQWEMIHPETESISLDKKTQPVEHLTAIYPTTKGLHQPLLRKIIKQALQIAKNHSSLAEIIPQEIMGALRYPSLLETLHTIHCPLPQDNEWNVAESHPLRKRLAFEELISHHVGLYHTRLERKSFSAYGMNVVSKKTKQLMETLPFELTNAQSKAFNEIIDDLKKTTPMLRLLQGDVGSGKTIVAALAILSMIEAGFQTVLMAPTELLAEQHLQNFQKWFAPFDISTGLLTSHLKNDVRKKMLQELKKGHIQLLIGTHAIFQEQVIFKNLAFIVIDEQHRFGVHQRLALQKKGMSNGSYPHQLIMSATPIPRTLFMTLHADLDCSYLDELPPNRQTISTVLIPSRRRNEVINRVRENCHLYKRQAYWVCTLIEESEVLQCQAAQSCADELKQYLPGLKIGLIHGRLKNEEKNQLMMLFKLGQIDLLVATTVIEVGVDVPNASLMIIENAERLGLAQLHQLRGRVGRGHQQSYCVLMYENKLSITARERLKILRQTQDGFLIAQKDLELRGAGEVFGARQAGIHQWRIADLSRDQDLLHAVHAIGTKIVTSYPHLIEPLLKRWVSASALDLLPRLVP